MKYIFSVSILLLISTEAVAESQLLPRGVGAYQGGYRKFDAKSQYFDEKGESHPIANKFNTDFNPASMASGKAGGDLKRLYQEMKKFESQGVSKGVADDMNFGSMRADVKTDIQAKFLGLAFGATDRVTLFGGLPFVHAQVDTDITYSSVGNNAAEIKARVGNLMYKEIQDALQEASVMSAETIRNNLEVTKGYKPVDHWQYDGIGDAVLGAKTEMEGKSFGLKPMTLGLSSQLGLATGYQDDPDNLIDVPISRGYHSLTVASDARYEMKGFEGAMMVSLTQGMNRDVSKRVANLNGEIPDASRKTTVHWEPGQDIGAGMRFGYGTSLLKGTYTVGMTNHLRDRFSGSMEGDYKAMEKDSESSKKFHQVAVSLSTTDAFAKKQIPIPFILTLSANDTFAGINTPREKYFELSITSFFATPMVRKAETRSTRNDKPKSSSLASR